MATFGSTETDTFWKDLERSVHFLNANKRTTEKYENALKQIAQLNDENKSLTEDIEELYISIEKRDLKINELNNEHNMFKLDTLAEIVELKQYIEKHDLEIEKFDLALNKQYMYKLDALAEVKELKQDIAKQSVVITQLQNKVMKLSGENTSLKLNRAIFECDARQNANELNNNIKEIENQLIEAKCTSATWRQHYYDLMADYQHEMDKHANAAQDNEPMWRQHYYDLMADYQNQQHEHLTYKKQSRDKLAKKQSTIEELNSYYLNSQSDLNDLISKHYILQTEFDAIKPLAEKCKSHHYNYDAMCQSQVSLFKTVMERDHTIEHHLKRIRELEALNKELADELEHQLDQNTYHCIDGDSVPNNN